ncbi:MAG: hypothetical protein ACLR07_07120 [Christensenellales bacterium]
MQIKTHFAPGVKRFEKTFRSILRFVRFFTPDGTRISRFFVLFLDFGFLLSESEILLFLNFTPGSAPPDIDRRERFFYAIHIFHRVIFKEAA